MDRAVVALASTVEELDYASWSNTTSARRVRVWNFPLSVTPRTHSTPLMLPRQTRRKTTFGRPVRVKVCPIIGRPPLRALSDDGVSHGLGDRGWPSGKFG